MTATRRRLAFDSLDAAVADAERLLAVGYDRTGKWDLAQVCGHLADWMTFPMDGYPKAPVAIRPMLWAVRHTVGRSMFRKVVGRGNLPAGQPTMAATVHAAGGDAAVAADRLRDAAARFAAFAGPIRPSPLFGRMTKDEATQLQLVHCAHHLSFLVPRG